MKRGRINKYLTALAAALAMLALAGCAWIGDALYSAAKTSEPLSPTAAAVSPAPTEEMVSDPVSALFHGYFKAFSAASHGLTEAVCEAENEEASRLYAEFEAQEALIAKLYAALSQLSRESGALDPEGSDALGSGEMKPDGGFSFRYADGSVLNGSLNDGRSLVCSYTEGGVSARLRLAKISGGFICGMERGSAAGVFELRGRLRFAYGESSLFKGSALVQAEFRVPEGASAFEYSDGALSFAQ